MQCDSRSIARAHARAGATRACTRTAGAARRCIRNERARAPSDPRRPHPSCTLNTSACGDAVPPGNVLAAGRASTLTHKELADDGVRHHTRGCLLPTVRCCCCCCYHHTHARLLAGDGALRLLLLLLNTCSACCDEWSNMYPLSLAVVISRGRARTATCRPAMCLLPGASVLTHKEGGPTTARTAANTTGCLLPKGVVVAADESNVLLAATRVNK